MGYFCSEQRKLMVRVKESEFTLIEAIKRLSLPYRALNDRFMLANVVTRTMWIVCITYTPIDEGRKLRGNLV